MQDLSVLFWACAVTVHVTSVWSQSLKESHYWRCNREDGIFQGNVIVARTAASRLACFAACSADDRCKSLNACPSSQAAGQWDCQLLDSKTSGFCRGLDTATHPHCFHAEKVWLETSSPPANNTDCDEICDGVCAAVQSVSERGQPAEDGTCKCVECTLGSDCSQYARDCLEAMGLVERGADSFPMCLILPASAPRPFRVRCNMNTGTSSLLWRRQDDTGSGPLDWSSYNWDGQKAGYSADKENFFVGLENMHLFLKQAKYDLRLYNAYLDPKPASTRNPVFRNLVLANESGKYAWSYEWYITSDSRESSSDSPTNYEAYKGPNVSHPFCAQDRDCGTCALDKGPGWYYVEASGQCVGSSPFAPIAQWPQGDFGMVTLGTTGYSMERKGGFY